MSMPADLAERRFDQLASVAHIADGSLSLEETVERLLEIVVPEFADLATIDALHADGSRRRLGVRIARGESDVQSQLFARNRRLEPALGMAGASGSLGSQLLSPLTDEHLQRVADGPEDLELVRSLGLGSALFVPLKARGTTIGALGCALRGDGGRAFEERDLRFAELLAGRIALALDAGGLSARVSGLERRFEAALQNLAEAVIVRDVTGRIVFANPAAVALADAGSPDELLDTSQNDLLAAYEVYDESGRRLGLDDMPFTKAIEGREPDPLLVRSLNRRTGAERWLMHKARPIFEASGEVSLVATVIDDVTDVKRTEIAQRLLAEASLELTSSLDYQQTLQRVAQMSVPDLADWCSVRIKGSGALLEQVAVAHSDPVRIALAREYGERYTVRASDPGGAAQVVRTGEAQHFEISEELLAAANASEEQLQLVRELEMRSIIIVPLAVPGREALGALTLVRAESGRVFDEEDLTLALELGRRAGSAVQNARIYTERSQIAKTLQESLLPPALPEVDGLRLASFYRAAGAQNEVGGDFYDVYEAPSGWVVVVGDVAGRGAGAAALTSLARYTLRAASRLLADPLAIIGQLNTALLERPELSLVSVCFALLRELDGVLQADVLLAGHPPAYLVHEGNPRQVGVFAPFLGLSEEGPWLAERVVLAPGDRLVLYTDGVIDTVGERDRFGEDRLAQVLRGEASAEETVARVEEELGAFASGLQPDDTAVLVVERVPAANLAQYVR